MKKLIFLILISMMIMPVFARSLSYIQQDGVWYRLYDENGKQYRSVSSTMYGTLKGHSGSLVIFQDGAFFYVYDSELNRLKSCALSTYGEVICVSGDTFTTKMGYWIHTYDKNGKKLNSRPAN